jgi:hypothetical protein
VAHPDQVLATRSHCLHLGMSAPIAAKEDDAVSVERLTPGGGADVVAGEQGRLASRAPSLSMLY